MENARIEHTRVAADNTGVSSLPEPRIEATSAKSGTKPKSKPLLPCPFHVFGCPATFPSKNEWKRHTMSQHLRLGFYRCSLGSCSIDRPSGVPQARPYNDFNRKDLFLRHVKSMHAGEGPRLRERDGHHPEPVRKSVKTKGKKPKGGHRARDAEEFDEAWVEQVRREAWVSVRLAPGGYGPIGCGFCDQKFGCEYSDAGESSAESESRA
jgi:hypothetical protein